MRVECIVSTVKAALARGVSAIRVATVRVFVQMRYRLLRLRDHEPLPGRLRQVKPGAEHEALVGAPEMTG